MAAQQALVVRPSRDMMFGITHDPDGTPIIREPKILKVGIGLPRGPACNVWMAPDNTWKIRVGFKQGEAKVYTFQSRAEAEKFYQDTINQAPVCNYPRKIGFFTFTRPVLVDGAERFEPDFPAIEAHGPTPTEIDIVFLDDQPFTGSYQMWSSAELKCHGDGINAMRVLSMATPEQRDLSEAAAAAGERYFPIIGGCWTCGCPYSKEPDAKHPSPCKPGGDLKFQLARNIRVGGTAYFHTTGYRSIAQIFSSLFRLKSLTGDRLVGIPLKMVLRPYKTTHNGQAATQYGVGLEFRAEDIEALRRNLIEQAWSIRKLMQPPQPVKMIEAGQEDPVDGDDDTPIGAGAMADEFYPAAIEEGEQDPQPTTASTQVAAATETKTAGLADKLKSARTRKQKPDEEAVGQKPTVEASAAQATEPVQPDLPSDPDDDVF